MTSWSLLEVQAELRAGERCEYCQMHQSLQGATFHVEHIVPRCRGGSSDFDNLAWAFPSCNLHKSDRVSAVAPGTDQEVSLFHPRVDRWHDRRPCSQSRTSASNSSSRSSVRSFSRARSRCVNPASLGRQPLISVEIACRCAHTTVCRKRGRPAASTTSAT
jgi:hypothetical protein